MSQKYYVRTMGISNLARPLALVIGVVLTSAAASPALAQSANQYQKACDGDLPACTSLGLAYEQGSGVPLDLARAVALFQQACDGANAPGCFNLGIAYEHGSGAPRGTARAAALLQKACDGGEPRACAFLIAAAEATEYERACQRGDAAGL